jgi:hypothetical protein
MDQKKTSNPTKKYKTLTLFFTILSFIAVAAPLIYYFATGFMIAEVTEKFVLSVSLILALVLTTVSVLAKMHIRAPLFIIILALALILDSIFPLILWICIGTIVDEILLTPLRKHFRNKYVINKEIDKRIK